MGTNSFYDNLSPFYHLIYADWENSISRQASQLDQLIKLYWAEPIRTILDVACDNAIPHLLSDAEILKAFQQFFRCVRPGGGVLISVRDYDQEERGGTQLKPCGLRVVQGKRYFLFQVWDFEGDLYELSMYLVEDNQAGECVTHVMRTHYYAIGMAKLIELLQQAGFVEVQRVDNSSLKAPFTRNEYHFLPQE